MLLVKKIQNAREMLIAEGHRELFGSGYSKLDIKKITASCGLAIGTFYNHFPGKKDFAMAVIADDCAERWQQIEELLSEGLSLKDTLAGIVEVLRRYRQEIDAIFWQIPLELEESKRLMEGVTLQIGTIAKRLLDGVGADNCVVGEEHVVSLVSAYLLSVATVEHMDFEDFYVYLSTLLGQGAGSDGSHTDENPTPKALFADTAEITRGSLRRIGETAPGPVGIYLVKDDVFETIYSSPELPRMFETEDGEYVDVTRANALEAVMPSDRAAVVEAARRCIMEGTPVDFHYRVCNPTRRFDWIHARARRYGTMDGLPVLITMFTNTSTETDIYQDILDHTDRMIYVCDRETYEILYANQPAQGNYGSGHGSVVGTRCYETVRGKTAPCEDCPIRRMRDDGASFFERLEEHDGIWKRISGRSIDWCGHDALLHYVGDVTEQQIAAAEVVRSRQMYEAAVEDAQLVVWDYDIINHRIIMSENEFTEYDYRKFGLPKVTENAPQALIHYIDDDSVADFLEMYRQVEAGAPKASCEVWYKLKPGQEPRCESISYTTVFDDEGKPVSAFGIGRNITTQKLDEKKFDRMYADLANIIPGSLGTFRLNLTKNICSDGQSPFESVMKQQESGTVDGYFEESARIIANERDRARFLETFTRKRMLEAFQDGATKVSLAYPIHIPLPDGPLHWIEGNVAMAQNPDTGDVEAVTTGIDVTERVKDEQIRHLLFEQGYDLIGIIDPESGGLTLRGGSWNPDAIRERLGISDRGDEELDYRSCVQTLLESATAPEDVEELRHVLALDNLVSSLGADEEYTVTFRYLDGSRQELRKQVRFSWLDDLHHDILVTSADVTASYRREQRRIRELDDARGAHLHASALLQGILDTTPTAMFWKDVDRRFEGANRAFLDFYGFDSTAVILGKTDEDMGWHPDPGPYRDDEIDVIEKGVSTHRVPGTCMSHGKLHHIVASKSPRYEDGRIVGLVGNFEDVTQEYEHTQAMATLNDELTGALDAAEQASAAEQAFLSSMSHDMRTPLNGIIGFTELALGTDDHDRRQDYLEKIAGSGKLMLDLVNDVLDMSKIESGKLDLQPEAFESRGLFDAVVDSVRLSAEERNLSLLTVMDESYPRFILADRLRMQQIALNLLSNAIKYTPDGGTVRFEVHISDGHVDGCNTLLRVTDTGIGMSAEFQKRMYEPFSQEHQSRMYGTQGTGLGLSIVRRIVGLMGGHIEMESELGKGTTFDVYLRVEPVETGRTTGEKEGTAQGDITGWRILLCEDNDLNAEIAETILCERGGAEYVRAADGKEGLETFISSEEGAFDAILMDVRMPKMDGLETTRAIRALARLDAATIPIVAMTADAFAEDVRRCLDAGMDGHIAKPIDPAKLISSLAEAREKAEEKCR